jgi:alanyl-tRNA synthetase
VFADAFGHATVSVHFGDGMSTLDLDTPSVDPDRVREAEARANAVIFENREVAVTFEDAAAAAGLRKPTDRQGAIRVVAIEGIDRSACGGTHVRRTGEIGVLLLRRQEKVRKNARIEFVCGGRAARRARQDFEALSAMAQSMSASFDEVPGLVATMQRQWKDGEAERRRLEGELAEYRARESYERTAPDAAGVRRFVQLLERGGPDEWRSFAIAFSTLPRAACVVGARGTNAVLLAAAADSGIDAGATLKALLPTFGGRGGGSPRLAQGSLPDADAFARALAILSSTADA